MRVQSHRSSRLFRVVVALLAMAVVMLPTIDLAGAQGGGVAYQLILDCPDTTNGACPIEAWDVDDALGDPAIAVDPDNVNNMIIASLHGAGQATDGPTPKSRPGQSYTTHTSTNHGASWSDRPWTPPDSIPFDAYGEHPSIALDPYGHVFIGSLYSIPVKDEDNDRTGAYEYVLAAQKFANLDDIRTNQDGEYNTRYLGSVYPGNRITETWYRHNPITDNVTVVWTEQVTAHSGGAPADGDDTVGQSFGDVLGRVPATPGDGGGRSSTSPAGAAGIAGAIGRVAGATGQPGTGNPVTDDAPSADQPMSIIAVRWTDAQKDTTYHPQPLEWAIGPCSTSTNPVISENWLYIGCRVADGEGPLRWDAAAESGDIALFRFHPDGGEPNYLGLAPVSDGAPKLGVRSDGRIALMTTEVLDTNDGPRIRLDGSFGRYQPSTGLIDWGPVHRYGERLQVVFANAPYVESNIQDMIYREYSGVIHLIFKRVIEWPDTELAYRPSLFKSIVAIDEDHGLLAEFDLGIGALVHRAKDYNLFLMDEARFNDISDDFLELPAGPFRYQGRNLGDSYQRQFYAVGNYGIINFAEVIELTDLRGPGVPALPNPPPPPTPAPAASSTLALGMAGALTASSLVAGTAASLKRKSVTGAGRKKRM